MKIRGIIAAVAAVAVPFLLFRVGSGFTEQTNAVLHDYTLSEDGKTMTLNAGVWPAIGFIRDFKDEPKDGEHYITFYSTPDDMTSSLGAEYTFDLPIEDTDKAVYFNDSKGFHVVLQKNAQTGEWVKP